MKTEPERVVTVNCRQAKPQRAGGEKRESNLFLKRTVT